MREMVSKICIVLIFGVGAISSYADQDDNQRTPGEKKVDRFDKSAQGGLRILYTDGSDVIIPKEHGRHKRNEVVLTQEAFEEIEISEDRRLIGWLASYMLCSQSYPCAPELVVFDSIRGQRYISAPKGIVSEWRFIKQDSQLVLHYGFPHGEEAGSYALYDAASGKKISDYDASTIPDWVRDFHNERIRSMNRQIDELQKR